jgi:hypothetical protein
LLTSAENRAKNKMRAMRLLIIGSLFKQVI